MDGILERRNIGELRMRAILDFARLVGVELGRRVVGAGALWRELRGARILPHLVDRLITILAEFVFAQAGAMGLFTGAAIGGFPGIAGDIAHVDIALFANLAPLFVGEAKTLGDFLELVSVRHAGGSITASRIRGRDARTAA